VEPVKPPFQKVMLIDRNWSRSQLVLAIEEAHCWLRCYWRVGHHPSFSTASPSSKPPWKRSTKPSGRTAPKAIDESDIEQVEAVTNVVIFTTKVPSFKLWDCC